jgi:hypothetical protein
MPSGPWYQRTWIPQVWRAGGLAGCYPLADNQGERCDLTMPRQERRAATGWQTCKTTFSGSWPADRSRARLS